MSTRVRIRARYLIALFLTVVVTASSRAIVFPSQDSGPTGNAVVVYAGGEPNERIERALDLIEAGAADTLVISEGNRIWAQGTHVERLCAEGHPAVSVVCVIPLTDNTRGESATFAALAHERGWDELVLVSSRDHLYRSSTWLQRCLGRPVTRVGSDPVGSTRYVHEWFGIAHALTLDRSCPTDENPEVSADWVPTNEPSNSPSESATPDDATTDDATAAHTSSAQTDTPTDSPSDSAAPAPDGSDISCHDWIGRRLVMSIYSVPVDHPDTRTVDQLSTEGYTHFGPWYAEDRWTSGRRASELGFCIIFTVGKLQPKSDALADASGALQQVREDVSAALADPMLNASISMWSVLPEELNAYRSDQRVLFEELVALVNELDPLGRPVYMYIQSNADGHMLEHAAQTAGILGQGNYLSTNGYHDQRVYLKASILRATETLSSLPEGDGAVLPVVEHRIHDGSLDPALVPQIQSWVRHDLFTSLVLGTDGFLAFSGFPPKSDLATFEHYNEAYATVLAELHATRMPELYEFGAVSNDVRLTVVAGPTTLTVPVLFNAPSGSDTETFASLSDRSWILDGRHTTLIVNHASEAISLQLDVGSQSVDGSLLTSIHEDLSNTDIDVNNGLATLSLPAHGVAVVSWIG